MKKTDAESKLRKMVGEVRGKYCPQIRTTCVRNCACFYAGSLRKRAGTDDEYEINPPSCTHGLIGGIVYVESVD